MTQEKALGESQKFGDTKAPSSPAATSTEFGCNIG